MKTLSTFKRSWPSQRRVSLELAEYSDSTLARPCQYDLPNE
ncbi:hypothetical protein CaCOL14_003515 [Colletotrichum acutatum]